MQKKIHSNDLKKQVSICLFVFSVGIWFLFQTDLDNHHHFFLPRNLELRGANGYSVSGPGCHIPDLDPYDPSIQEALDEAEPPPACDKNSTGVLVKSNLTHLYIDRQILAKLNLTGDLTCCYRPFWRVKSNSKQFDPNVDSKYKYLDKCVPFREEVYMEAVDFVRVECRVEDQIVYKDFYAFIPNSYRHKAGGFFPKQNMSVLVLGIDGLSRLNFRRQMILTHDFLTKQIRATEFYGYHKVEDNTFPNLIPVLAGLSEKELSKSCWPDYRSTFDNCSFIWKNFKNAGFITGFGEDASWMGLFQYGKTGFREQPTDVYLRPFNHVYENELGHEKRLNANLCVGAKMNIEVLLDAVNKFVLRLEGKSSFGFFWENSLSHDYLNLPKYGDDVHVALLEGFFKQGIFNQSAVIIMSDHGIRWGKIRTTYQGYVEERLPLFLISCPVWFQQKFPLAWANLQKNAQRLTTPYDLHETLKDFTDLTFLSDDKIIERSRLLREQIKIKMPRGMSLFLPIPSERTCDNADIADHWCTCHKDEDVPTNDTHVINSAIFVLDHINSLLKGYIRCSKLSIKIILNARVKVLPSGNAAQEDKVTDYGEHVRDYTLRLEAQPGGGVFEATIQYSPFTDTFKLMGSVSRSNTYGNSSYCVSHYKLKLYCYCAE